MKMRLRLRLKMSGFEFSMEIMSLVQIMNVIANHRRVQSLHHLNDERIRTWMKVQKPWHQHSKESSRARRGQSYTCPAASLVVRRACEEQGEG